MSETEAGATHIIEPAIYRRAQCVDAIESCLCLHCAQCVCVCVRVCVCMRVRVSVCVCVPRELVSVEWQQYTCVL